MLLHLLLLWFRSFAMQPSPSSSSSSPTIFHQRQQWLRCGLHAVNNVLQADVARASDFQHLADAHALIAGRGPWLHRLGLGDYDANTMIEFLQDRAHCSVEFINQCRANAELSAHLADPKLLQGFLVNVQRRNNLWQQMMIPSFIHQFRHWYAVVYIKEEPAWYVVDSSQHYVEKLDNVQTYLEQTQADVSLDATLLVVKGPVERSS